MKGAKRLIFTQYADTAKYLFDNLNPDGKHPDIEVIFSGDKSKETVVGRFAPKANPEYRFAKDEAELMTVIATDVLAEGLEPSGLRQHHQLRPALEPGPADSAFRPH